MVLRNAARRLMFATIITAAACSGARSSSGLAEADRAAIRALDGEYVRAWLADDTAGVMATLAADAVLMPANVRPLQGDSAIRAFWWPADGSRTSITSYETTVDEIDGAGGLAYVRGTGQMAFDYQKDAARTSHRSETMTLTVVRKQEDGRWKIARRMWGPLAPR